VLAGRAFALHYSGIFLPERTVDSSADQTNKGNKDFDAGLATRKQVMGEDFVANAFGNATDFTLPMQHYITRNAWGDVWRRPGLDMKTRSLITVAMLTALGKQHELKSHVRGALNNGASIEQIQEVLLHASIYCGVPSAVDAFRSAAEVVDGARKS
jgi:4-carboxymuconolactone decarboxylase